MLETKSINTVNLRISILSKKELRIRMRKCTVTKNKQYFFFPSTTFTRASLSSSASSHRPRQHPATAEFWPQLNRNSTAARSDPEFDRIMASLSTKCPKCSTTSRIACTGGHSRSEPTVAGFRQQLDWNSAAIQSDLELGWIIAFLSTKQL